MTVMQVSNLHEMYPGKRRKCPWVCCVSSYIAWRSNSESAQLQSSGRVSTERGHSYQKQPQPQSSQKRGLIPTAGRCYNRWSSGGSQAPAALRPCPIRALTQPWEQGVSPEPPAAPAPPAEPGHSRSQSWAHLQPPVLFSAWGGVGADVNWWSFAGTCKKSLMHKLQSLFIQP